MSANPPSRPPKRYLPPEGQRAFEHDEARGRWYTLRYTADGHWARTPLRGVEPGPGDRVLTIKPDGSVRADRVTSGGRLRRIPVTDDMRRAGQLHRQGLGVAVDLAQSRPGSKRGRALEGELRRRHAESGKPDLQPTRRHGPESQRGQRRRERLEEAAGRRPPPPPAGPLPADELARDRYPLGASLGISPADLQTARRPEQWLQGPIDMVLAQGMRQVGRGEVRLKDVYGEFMAGNDTQVLQALMGSPGGLMSQLDPRQLYRVVMNVRATDYAGNSDTFRIVTQDAAPRIARDPENALGPGSLLSAIMAALYAVLPGHGWAMSSGRGADDGPGDHDEEVDMLDITLDVFSHG